MTSTTVCSTPITKARRPTTQAIATAPMRSRRMNARSPASSSPALNQTGVIPGPPGCRRSTSTAVTSLSDRAREVTPGSNRNRLG